MKFFLRMLPLVMLACLLPAAYAADLSGVWKGSFDFQDRENPTTLHLNVSGAAVTGTVEGLPDLARGDSRWQSWMAACSASG